MVTVAPVDEQIKKDSEDRELLVKVWAAFRGVAMGAPLDADYARQLADEVWSSFLHQSTNG